MSPILNEVGTVFIPVSNIGRARDWYCDILGLTTEEEVQFGHLFVIPMNGTGIVLDSKLYSEDSIFIKPAFHFNTKDIHKAYEYMKSKDVELISSIEHGHWFNFKDPDGNVLMVCKC
ncbi:VOC family protein [Oceanobacillus massiliensis]|uniref:VOC family protein n=1 Tax=Oceanobacillus massiliensis TaxID=1465765 RepID=UPI000288FD52|nr:VOC family protein [Oceanobacillus massiliensis]